MANTDTETYASTDELRRALGIFYDLKESNPLGLEGTLAKHPEINPFTQWPVRKEPVEAFLRYFETTTPVLERGAETITPTIGPYTETVSSPGLQPTIDAKKLDDLIEVFNKDYAEAKEGRLKVATTSKNFVAALIKQAKKSAVVPIKEPEAPAKEDAVAAPIAPERVQAIAAAVIQHPGPIEEKPLMFHALETFSSERPEKSVEQLIPRAVAVTETTRVFATRQEELPRERSFQAVATTGIQRAAAQILDVVVPPSTKEIIIDKLLLKPLETIVNHPDKLPKPLMDELTARWGQNFVSTPWFDRLRRDTNGLMADKSGALKVRSGLTNFVSDLATSVFRGPNTVELNRLAHSLHNNAPPPGGSGAAVRYNLISYIETCRLSTTQGFQISGDSQYSAIVLGYGGMLVRTGTNYLIRKGTKAAAKKIAGAVAKKAAASALSEGATAAGGAAAGTAVEPGLGTLIGAALGFLVDIAKGIFNKGVNFAKKLFLMGSSGEPQDQLVLVVGAAIVFIFFLPFFPLLNIPAFNQSMIDTSIATNVGGPAEQNTEGSTINCETTPDAPECQFTACVGSCSWPASGVITQGPRTGAYCAAAIAAGDPPSHASGTGMNGIDIAAVGGGPVYTPRAGTVTNVYSDCANNTMTWDNMCGGSGWEGWGNHVVIQTDDGYTLIFGHMESAIGVQVGQQVVAGTQVGWMDATGRGSGTHLHFGVLAGGNVLDFVPSGNPALSPATIEGCVNATGCTKPCPSTPVVAGSQ